MEIGLPPIEQVIRCGHKATVLGTDLSYHEIVLCWACSYIMIILPRSQIQRRQCTEYIIGISGYGCDRVPVGDEGESG